MINIEHFNISNKDHLKLYEELCNDNEVKSNVTSIYNINNYSYIINNSINNIGILKIIPEIDNYSIDMGILNKYTNKGYGSEALENALELIYFIDEDFNKVIVRTRFNNQPVINCSRKIGFTYDIEEIEKSNEEGEEYLVLSKYNKKHKIKTMV